MDRFMIEWNVFIIRLMNKETNHLQYKMSYAPSFFFLLIYLLLFLFHHFLLILFIFIKFIHCLFFENNGCLKPKGLLPSCRAWGKVSCLFHEVSLFLPQNTMAGGGGTRTLTPSCIVHKLQSTPEHQTYWSTWFTLLSLLYYHYFLLSPLILCRINSNELFHIH
jgi:hypothetical protein